MGQLSTTHKIKQSLILLSKTISAEKVSVIRLIEFAGISRATFYTYYTNITEVWQQIANDVLFEMSTLKKDPLTLFSFSNYEHLEQLAHYIYKRKAVIQMLLSKNGDPLFLSKWEQKIKSFILERINQEHSNPTLKKDKIAGLLAIGAVGSIIKALLEDDSPQILFVLTSTEDMLSCLAANKYLFEN